MEGVGRIRVDASAHARRAAAVEFLSSQPSGARVLIIGPHRAASRALVRDAVGEAAFGWDPTTPGFLAGRVASPGMANRGLSVASSASLDAIVTHAIRALGSTGLGRFAELADFPGFPRAVRRTLAEIRGLGASQDVRQSLRRKAPELDALLGVYEAELQGRGMVDHAGVLRLATAEAPTSELLEAAVIWLDAPVSDPVTAAWAQAVFERARDSLVVLPHGDEISLRHLDGEPCRAESDAGERDTLARLREGLFEELEQPDDAPPREIDSAETAQNAQRATVTIFSAPGESRECVEIARRILGAARDGIAFDRMAVILRSPERYRSHLALAFDRAEIPIRSLRGTRAPDPSGRALLALLDCRVENFSARGFGEYLSFGVVPRLSDGEPPAAAAVEFVPPESEMLAYGDEPERAETPTEALVRWAMEDPVSAGGGLRIPRRWESLVVDAAVIGGKERWARRIDGLDQGVRRALEQHREIDGTARASLEQRRADLANLRRFALPLIEELAGLPTSATWGEWIDTLSDLASRALQEPERVVAALTELSPMRSVGPVGLAQVRQALDSRLRDMTAPRRPDELGVSVITVEEARGMAFERVFVPGLAERMFPRRVSVDPLLRDELRQELELPTRQTQVGLERLALRLCVGAARTHLVVSWPRMDLDAGRGRVPSFYALEVDRARTGKLPDLAEFEARAEAAGAAELGWPAPKAAPDAIDAAEFDLARLRDQLAEGAGSGGMAHLLDGRPDVRRSLGARARRWDNPNGWTRADGLLVDASTGARALLDSHRIENRRFSATALQRFAACPYQFFLNQILRLQTREVPEPLDELDALSRGSLIHEIQFRVLLRLRDAGWLPLSDPARLQTAFEVLSEVSAEVAREWEDDVAPAIPRVWQDGLAQIEMDCRRWLVRLGDNARWRPTHFELAFGMKRLEARDPRSRDEPATLAGGLQLRGSIDLVESSDAGLRASDYKTGRASAKKGLTVEGGATLQPVLYAMALEALFPDEAVVGGRLDYCTTRGGFESREVALDDDARAAVDALVSTYTAFLEVGFLPALPRDARTCQWCDYLPICGPHEAARTEHHKPADRPPSVRRLHLLRALK